MPGKVTTDEAGRVHLTTGAGRRYTFDGDQVSYVSREGVKRTSDFSSFHGTSRTQALNHFRHVSVVEEAWQSSGRIELENLSYSPVRLQTKDGQRRCVVGVSLEERPMTVLSIEGNGERASRLVGDDAKDQMFLLGQSGVSEESIYLALSVCNSAALADADYVEGYPEGPQPVIEMYGVPVRGAVPLYQRKAAEAAVAKKASDKANLHEAKKAAIEAKSDAWLANFMAESEAAKASKAERKANKRGFFG